MLQITEQGIPDEAMPAYKNGHEPLPTFPLFNMMNKYGHRVSYPAYKSKILDNN